jgi:hypothetical protein
MNPGRTAGRLSFSTAKATKLDWQKKPGASFGGKLHRKRCMQGEVAEDGGQISNVPLRGTLSSLPPVTVEVVSQTAWEPLWDDLVRSHHYLGYQKLLGRRLKYLAFMGKRPVAALSFSAPAWGAGSVYRLVR